MSDHLYYIDGELDDMSPEERRAAVAPEDAPAPLSSRAATTGAAGLEHPAPGRAHPSTHELAWYEDVDAMRELAREARSEWQDEADALEQAARNADERAGGERHGTH